MISFIETLLKFSVSSLPHFLHLIIIFILSFTVRIYFVCSRGGTRTHTLRLRRALLYPIKPLDYAKPKLKIASKITTITPVANTPIAKISDKSNGIML